MTDPTSPLPQEATLPSFAHPPVIEVALAVEFRPVPTLGAANLVRLADRWGAEYPTLQELPALPPSTLPGAAGAIPGMVVSVGAPAIRLLRISADRDRMIQLQRDRLVVNWQRHDSGYPHYRRLRPALLAAWDDLTSFVGRAAGSDVQAVAAELTFVNRLNGDGARALGDAVKGGGFKSAQLGEPGALRMSQVWRGTTGSRDWTVQVAADSAPPGGPILTVTYREGLSSRPAMDDITDALDRGHVTAVTVFDEITTERAHTRWGRHQ